MPTEKVDDGKYYEGTFNNETQKKWFENLAWWMAIASEGVGGAMLVVGIWYLSSKWGVYVAGGGIATMIGGGVAVVSTLLKKT
jgi:hypothetical protein